VKAPTSPRNWATSIKRRYGEEFIKAFIQSRPPDGIPGRRSMPQFNLTDEQLNASWLS
jgi:hypothetical protein